MTDSKICSAIVGISWMSSFVVPCTRFSVATILTWGAISVSIAGKAPAGIAPPTSLTDCAALRGAKVLRSTAIAGAATGTGGATTIAGGGAGTTMAGAGTTYSTTGCGATTMAGAGATYSTMGGAATVMAGAAMAVMVVTGATMAGAGATYSTIGAVAGTAVVITGAGMAVAMIGAAVIVVTGATVRGAAAYVVGAGPTAAANSDLVSTPSWFLSKALNKAISLIQLASARALQGQLLDGGRSGAFNA
mmetsp:Transcript_14591/g.34450  ORF Transcript_14591/g.34450 Transcript_14591/m.34450 type:complete len:248 (+) Transcript_14591:1-744(+)